jgi:AcrR family transcriptional regulator
MRKIDAINDKANSDKAFSRDEQRQQKRMAVLRAGAQLFRERGFDRTSLDDIANELVVSKRTLYYYVESKDDILFQCNRLALEFMDDAVQQTSVIGSPALDRIKVLLRSYASLLANDFGACLVLVRVNLLPVEQCTILREGRKKIDVALRQLIREGIDDGSISPCEPKYATAAIFGALNWIPHWYSDKETQPYEQIVEQLLAVLLDGLRARSQGNQSTEHES